jgi:UDP-3-O-acyl-N-acetylglucosamine deacetylase
MPYIDSISEAKILSISKEIALMNFEDYFPHNQLDNDIIVDSTDDIINFESIKNIKF